jgi:type II secretory pathway component GspD/PulD (secretin)
MNTAITRIISAACAAGLLASAVAQDPVENPNPTPAEAQDNTRSPVDAQAQPVEEPAPVVLEPENDAATQERPASQAPGNPDEIRLNFRNAPLDRVLNHLSEAAGFVVVMETTVRGNVTVMNNHPMTRDEAVDLLNSVLGKNGYAAIRDGRTLTIVDRSSAKSRNIPVKVSNDPSQIPANEEVVTQIIPIRYVEAEQLAKDLSTFVSSQATFVANAAGNSIVMTDTQSNIRHLVEIIRAIDTSAQSETEIRVFKLKNANPGDIATLLTQLFSTSTGGTGNNQAPIRFGGFGGGGFGGFGGFGGRGGGGGGGGGNTASSGANDRIRKASQVISVADQRTSSVVVTASKDLMTQIAGMVRELDVPSGRDQKVYVFKMENGDPQQAVQVLQNMFQGNNTARGNTSGSAQQNSALMQRQQNNSSSSSTTVNGANQSSFGGTGGRTGGGNQF